MEKRATASDEFRYFTQLKAVGNEISETHTCSIVIPEVINSLLLKFAVSQPAKHAVLLSAFAIMIQKYHGIAEVTILNPLHENHESCGKILPAYIAMHPVKHFRLLLNVFLLNCRKIYGMSVMPQTLLRRAQRCLTGWLAWF